MATKSKADFFTTGDCVDDTSSFDYCGENAPFRGCNAPPAEWICMCRLPSGKWWSECSVMEDTTGKQTYINQCGGDQNKASLQWKYDVAILETGGKCSCGGQNVCGSLVPTKRPPIQIDSSGTNTNDQVIETPFPTLPPFINEEIYIPPNTLTPFPIHQQSNQEATLKKGMVTFSNKSITQNVLLKGFIVNGTPHYMNAPISSNSSSEIMYSETCDSSKMYLIGFIYSFSQDNPNTYNYKSVQASCKNTINFAVQQ